MAIRSLRSYFAMQQKRRDCYWQFYADYLRCIERFTSGLDSLALVYVGIHWCTNRTPGPLIDFLLLAWKVTHALIKTRFCRTFYSTRKNGLVSDDFYKEMFWGQRPLQEILGLSLQKKIKQKQLYLFYIIIILIKQRRVGRKWSVCSWIWTDRLMFQVLSEDWCHFS